MADQHQFWNQFHEAHGYKAEIDKPNGLARRFEKLIPAAADILELGCGVGNDSTYFAGLGHPIVATDFSEVVIKQNIERYHIPSLSFQALDVTQLFPFTNGQFEAVYARLSLHFFNDADTRQIFSEIARVLKPGGKFCFMCRTTDDPNYQKEGNPKRHYFTEAYAKDLVKSASLTLESIEQVKNGTLYSKPAAFLTVIANKP
jgi:SAM-dependent methyltransferase